MESWIISSLIVLVASILQACTGFGFSIMATPFLFLVYEPQDAIQINIILSLIISIFMVPKIGKEVDKTLLVKLMKGSIIGLPIGLIIFLFLEVRLLKLVISILILLLTLLLMMNLKLKQTKRKDFLAGCFAGTLTTSIGMPGPPLLLYFSGAGTEKAILRSTTLAFYLLIYLISLMMQIFFGGTNLNVWVTSLVLMPITICGIFLGQLLFKWINQRIFQIITYFILGFTGVYLLLENL
ncbi:sulfite exporter TauE/SafE family protein [Metabacillus arenae]|uniref:Probable membrane transporter protein n=1 Tax=Metabacillus arenae TaxID=2771434 RepID=A0A926RYT4_9BACI|nr:sulfite exporter TauE/SafE family protein [Metabacillus arenae]MBD1382411.1 sulfite exporter TauE/SafE family protein [Metabacillus arenae]